QILVEVPARRTGLAEVLSDPAVERVGLAADQPVLFGQREVHREIRGAELLDLAGRARLLPAEVVGRNAEHDEPTIAIALPQRFEIAVLWGVPAKGSGIDDEHRAPAPRIERQGLAVDRNELEAIGVIGVSHRDLRRLE